MNIDEFFELLEQSPFDFMGFSSAGIQIERYDKRTGRPVIGCGSHGNYIADPKEVKSYIEKMIALKGTDKRPRDYFEQRDLDNYPIHWHYKSDQEMYEMYIQEIKDNTEQV